MRPGSRWNGDATSPIAAAIYCALVALIVAFALSYVFGRFGMGVVAAKHAWDSPGAFHLAALNLYASQHVPLLGYGTIPGESALLRAHVTFPLTLWALIPFFALILGGSLAARSRTAAGRWGMIFPAVAGGVLYAVVLTAAAAFVGAKFASVALPAVNGTEFNPPPVPFRPSVANSLWACGVFAVISTYLGAILAVRFSPQHTMAGKWWACMKAIFVTGLLIQLLFAAVGFVMFTRSEMSGDAKFVQVLPAVAGIGYSAVYGASLSYGALPTAMPSAGYSGRIELYRGIVSKGAGATKHSRFGGYGWIAAGLAALVAFLAGRQSVRLGSRDGSLPTAFRIVILQAAYTALIMWLCGLGWGMAGQFRAYMSLHYDPVMLIAAAGVFVFALVGAHWANQRYVGRLVGYPSA